MLRPRVALWPAALALAAVPALWSPLCAQTVISTHSGVLYFFEGSVFLGNQQLQQKFGRFPDIGEGNELRTEQGRAEVLLTPGVFLRIGDNSAIRMVSENLADTRVELLSGSAIMETNQNAPDTSVTLQYKDWQVRTPQAGVYRIDAGTDRLQVFRGQAEVSTNGKDPVTVTDNQTLPLAAVLAPEPSELAPGDQFKSWAMNRSQAVSADNAIAGEIVDDPSQLDASAAAGGFDASGMTYFPLTGVPSLGISNPYGVSFWSPYQPTLNALYFPTYLYTPYYLGWPTGSMIYPRTYRPTRIGGAGLRYLPTTPGLVIPRTGTSGMIRSAPRTIVAPRPAAAPHMGGIRR